jgi:hypothetical protein
MTAHQEDIISAALTVAKTCNRYPTVTAQIPGFVTALGDAGVKVQYIQGQAQIQAGNTTGLTKNKAALKKALCKKTFEIAQAVLSYASTVNDLVLTDKVNFTLTDVSETRDTEIGGFCQNVRDVATANLTKLTDYGVTTADMTDLAQKIAAYNEALASPADARVSKSTATANIAAAIADLLHILENRMDTLMPKFEAISPDFMKDYTSARNVIATGGGGAATPPPTPPPVPPAAK